MKPEDFWQNFKLGQEVEIASNFIYDGLLNFHRIDIFEEREIFPVLYCISIGLERLCKVAIILTEFTDGLDVKKFEDSLKTHSHTRLMDRIKKNHTINIEDRHDDFLKLLSEFYQNQRYDRFSLTNLTVESKDKDSFLKYLNDHASVDTSLDGTIIGLSNSPEIRIYLGQVVKDFVDIIFAIIKNEAQKKNLYTDEISSGYSKAAKVLLRERSIAFDIEDTARLEALIFMMSTDESTLAKTLREIKPLDLDPALSSDYLKSLLQNHIHETQSLVDEVESNYEDDDNASERIDFLNTLKNNSDSF